MMQFGKGIYIMNQTKIQDVIRHIRAKEMGNTNDLAYFGRIEEIYAKVIADKLRKEEHLWVVYSSTTSYPYMVDSDLFVLFNPKNSSLIEKKLKLSGYEVSVGVENNDAFAMELCHMYRNGYKNIRLTDGDKLEYVIPREAFGTYNDFLFSGVQKEYRQRYNKRAS